MTSSYLDEADAAPFEVDLDDGLAIVSLFSFLGRNQVVLVLLIVH